MTIQNDTHTHTHALFLNYTPCQPTSPNPHAGGNRSQSKVPSQHCLSLPVKTEAAARVF